MKKLFKTLLIVTVAVTSFAACQKSEESVIQKDDIVTLKFNIKNVDNAVVSKAVLGTEDGKQFLDWENGDKIGTFSVGTFGDFTTSNNNAGTVEVSGSDFTLNVQTFNSGSVTDIYSYFPYSAAAGKDKTAAVMTIPAIQQMTVDGFDADAMPMAGAPVTVDLETDANTDTPCGTINFSNLGSIINFKVYSSVETDETLTSVKYVSTDGAIGGTYTIDLSAVDGSDETTLALGGFGTEAEITTNCRTNPAIPTGKANAIDVFMVVAPGTHANSQVIVTTSAKTYTLTASSSKTFERSHIKPMNVDIQNGTPGELPVEETWTKVTSASDFTAGTYYILRADGAYYVPNASGNPTCVAYTAGDDITNAMKWTASVSGSGLVFESVANPGEYLYTTNTGSANTISVTASSTGSSASKVWTFETVKKTINDVEYTYYTATAGGDKYLVSYGTSNWRYYASSNINANNIPAEFYKLDENDTRADSGIEWSEATGLAEINTEGIEYALPTLTNPNNLTVIYASSDPTVATIDASTGVITALAAGTTTISAEFAGDATYKPITATYTLTVEDLTIVANDGSLAHPYTASEARALALDGDEGSYYISGIVTKVQNQYSASYGTANFWIDENGTSQTVFEGYKIKYFGNESWVESNAEIAVNDEVIIYGTLTVYTNTTSGTTTPETSSGYLVSLNGKTRGLTLDSMSATADKENKQITVTWGSATGSESAISYLVSCGTQTYTASAAGSYTFTMADYGTYNVYVVASAEDAVSATATTTVAMEDPSSTSTTVSMTTFTAVSGYVDNDENISYAAEKGGASTAPAIYSGVIRIYQNGGTLTITANNDKKIESITLGSSMSTTVLATVDGVDESSNRKISANSTTTVSGLNATKVVFTCKGTTSSERLYVNSLSVTYK